MTKKPLKKFRNLKLLIFVCLIFNGGWAFAQTNSYESSPMGVPMPPPPMPAEPRYNPPNCRLSTTAPCSCQAGIGTAVVMGPVSITSAGKSGCRWWYTVSCEIKGCATPAKCPDGYFPSAVLVNQCMLSPQPTTVEKLDKNCDASANIFPIDDAKKLADAACLRLASSQQRIMGCCKK